MAEKGAHVDVLDAEIWARFAVLEPGQSGVHEPDFVEVVPEGAGWGEIFSGDELY